MCTLLVLRALLLLMEIGRSRKVRRLRVGKRVLVKFD